MRFTYLDGMRGLGALFVLARHWNALLGLDFSTSYLAVDLFFTLSGFVIAHAYDAQLRSGAMAAGDFVRVRIARFYPVYALAVLLCLAVALTKAAAAGQPAGMFAEWCVSALCALLFVPFSVTGSAMLFPLNTAFWSLCQEMLVNLLYAATARLLSNRVLMAIVTVCALLLTATTYATGSIGHGYLSGLPSFLGGSLRAVFGIALGLLLYRQRARLHGLATMLPPWCSLLLVAAMLAAPVSPRYIWVIELGAVFLVFPLAILMGAAGAPAPGWHSRAMLALGGASYSLYLLHNPFLKLARRIAEVAGDWTRPAVGLLALAVVLLCVLIDRRFDQPAGRWLRARLRRKRTLPLASPG